MFQIFKKDISEIFAGQSEQSIRDRLMVHGLDYDDMKALDLKCSGIIGLGMLVIIPLTAFIYAVLFSKIAYIKCSSSFSDFDYIVLPSFAVWALHALTLGHISSILPISLLLKFILGKDRYEENNLYSKIASVGDPDKGVTRIVILVLLANCIFLPLNIDHYAVINNDSVVINRFRGFGKTEYTYEDVKEINLVEYQKKKSNGNMDYRLYHEIVFDDEYVFSFDRGWHNVNWDKQVEIVKFISEKSKKQIGKASHPYKKTTTKTDS